MKRLFLFMLFALHIAATAQTNDSQARIAHQQAESLFLTKNPMAQKVDLEKLSEVQKDEHKACQTCGLPKADLKTHEELPMTEERLAALKANQEKLIATTKTLVESGTADKELLKKYTNAIKSNQEQIQQGENELAYQRKLAKKSNK